MSTATQITTGRVRFSYANVFQPRAINGGDEKYSITLIIPKSDTKTLNKIKAAIKAAKENYIAKSGKKIPANVKTTLHDGDGTMPNSGKEYGPECKGSYVISVSAKRKPALIYSDKTPITEESEFYSGCYGRAIINFFYYNTNGNSGISAGLMGLMKLSDGEPLGGGVITDDDWAEDFEDTASDDLLG